MHRIILTLFLFFLLDCQEVLGQTSPEAMVDVNLDVLHEVEGISTLDRSKFITLHSTHTSKDLREEPSMFTYMMEKLDISFGRDMGRINWDLNQVAEDPARPGYPDYNHMLSKGLQSKAWYAGLEEVHHLEERSSLVVCPPVHPFWPDYSATNPHPCCGGSSYILKDVNATAELFGNWLNLYHGKDRMPPPAYFEVINEPLWEMVDNNQISDISKVFRYHKDLARGIRAINSEVQIGGYTAAIPAFYEDNFERWEKRWKLFIDSVGGQMDFFSLHFYDVYNNQGMKQFRKGSNLEATFDMLEHYSFLALDTLKPIVISEFGAQTNHLRDSYWSPYRDWLLLKSISPMWLSFMERPHLVAKAIPFVVTKATWYNSEYPYHHRLMRKASEQPGETGDHWVFTELIKVYELWAEVKGRRIDTYSTDPDIQTDAYVDGNEAYLIINNLEFASKTVGLKLLGKGDMELESVTLKHLYLHGDSPSLDTLNYSEAPPTVTLGSEATMVLKYSFRDSESLNTPESSKEIKYYADSYLHPIAAGSEEHFHIKGVGLENFGEGVLRLGIGRDHGASLIPEVKFNDSILEVPLDFRGDAQSSKSRFFGMLEVPVPYELIQTDNQISVKFTEDGGHISSLALQVFNSSRALFRSQKPDKFDALFQVSSRVGNTPIEGAMVVFAGDTTYTNADGWVQLDTIKEGIHTLYATAAGFEGYFNESYTHSGNTNFQIHLNPLSYKLSIHLSEEELGSPVYNARIEAGGSTAYTNRDGEATISVPYGLVSYQATHPYFKEFRDSIQMKKDSILQIHFRRMLADAKVVVWSEADKSRVRDAKVQMNDTSIYTNTLGLATFKALKVDTLYPYQVSRSGLTASEGSLLLKKDSTLNISLFTTGQDLPDGLADFRIYPVPVTQTLTIHLEPKSNKDLLISIVDQSGRERLTFPRNGYQGEKRLTLDVSDLESGIYLLILQQGSHSYQRKFMVK